MYFCFQSSQDPANKHPGSLIKLSFCFGGKKYYDLRAKEAERAVCKGKSPETNSGG